MGNKAGRRVVQPAAGEGDAHTLDYHEWTDHRDYDAWIKMFPEEVRPLVLSKAHLASPSLLHAVDALLESIEGLKTLRDLDSDDADEEAWLEAPIQEFTSTVHSDMQELRRQLWPRSAYRWMRDTWFQLRLLARKKVSLAERRRPSK